MRGPRPRSHARPTPLSSSCTSPLPSWLVPPTSPCTGLSSSAEDRSSESFGPGGSHGLEDHCTPPQPALVTAEPHSGRPVRLRNRTFEFTDAGADAAGEGCAEGPDPLPAELHTEANNQKWGGVGRAE